MARTRATRSVAVWAALAVLGIFAPDIARAQSEKSSKTTDDPMKEPLELIARAKTAFARVKDYSCKLIKRERFDGELSPNHVIELKVVQKPFSVSMLWQEPKELEGQEVVYVDGKYDGKMRVKPGGLLGSVGFISLPTNDPRTRKSSKHRITEAGIGNLIEKCAEGWELERQLKATTVKIGTYTYAKRRCTRVELTHANKRGGKIKFHKNVVYFDQLTNLPIRVENYGWPEEEGQSSPLIESFSYVNLRLNPGVPAEVFER
jgi:hypothetical protein